MGVRLSRKGVEEGRVWPHPHVIQHSPSGHGVTRPFLLLSAFEPDDMDCSVSQQASGEALLTLWTTKLLSGAYLILSRNLK